MTPDEARRKGEDAYFALRRMRDEGRLMDAFDYLRDLPAEALRELDRLSREKGFDEPLLPRIPNLVKERARER